MLVFFFFLLAVVVHFLFWHYAYYYTRVEENMSENGKVCTLLCYNEFGFCKNLSFQLSTKLHAGSYLELKVRKIGIVKSYGEVEFLELPVIVREKYQGSK